MQHIPSCDTLVAAGCCTKSGHNLFGKNSDRDVTESQPLIAVPAADHAPGDTLKCTYITIEQVPHTYRLIGSKPWWIWGFEHGVNEHGVAIGNEADWSNIPVSKEEGLLGMDLLRLGLERGKTAYEAMHVITGLLQKHGQGGACQYASTIEEFSYHNSFLLVDPTEIWLLETVDRHWAARKITDMHCISNVYSIEEEYDECSDGLIEFAVENGLHISGTPFNFSKSFLLLHGGVLSGHPRFCRMRERMAPLKGKLTVEDFKSILRDHYEGDTVENRWSPASVCSVSVCMHGIDPGPCQTAASMVVDYKESKHPELFFTYWGSMCPPCSTFFVPFYNTGYIPEKLSGGTNRYAGDSFWWRVNRMCVGIESNYERYIGYVQDIRPDLERQFTEKAAETEDEAAKLLDAGDREGAVALLNALTDHCLDRVECLVDEITKKIEVDRKENPAQSYRTPYLTRYRKKVGLDAF